MSDVTPVAHFALVPFNPGDTPQAVLAQADQALARAETEMRIFATPDTASATESEDDHHSWYTRLDAVLTSGDFALFSQPVYACNSAREVLHHKILARIKTLEGSWCLPDALCRGSTGSISAAAWTL